MWKSGVALDSQGSRWKYLTYFHLSGNGASGGSAKWRTIYPFWYCNKLYLKAKRKGIYVMKKMDILIDQFCWEWLLIEGKDLAHFLTQEVKRLLPLFVISYVQHNHRRWLHAFCFIPHDGFCKIKKYFVIFACCSTYFYSAIVNYIEINYPCNW